MFRSKFLSLYNAGLHHMIVSLKVERLKDKYGVISVKLPTVTTVTKKNKTAFFSFSKKKRCCHQFLTVCADRPPAFYMFIFCSLPQREKCASVHDRCSTGTLLLWLQRCPNFTLKDITPPTHFSTHRLVTTSTARAHLTALSVLHYF